MAAEHPCKGCYHWRGRWYGAECCHYIFDMGHRRPCPPGEACTVKQLKRKKNTYRQYGRNAKGE